LAVSLAVAGSAAGSWLAWPAALEIGGVPACALELEAAAEIFLTSFSSPHAGHTESGVSVFSAAFQAHARSASSDIRRSA